MAERPPERVALGDGLEHLALARLPRSRRHLLRMKEAEAPARAVLVLDAHPPEALHLDVVVAIFALALAADHGLDPLVEGGDRRAHGVEVVDGLGVVALALEREVVADLLGEAREIAARGEVVDEAEELGELLFDLRERLREERLDRPDRLDGRGLFQSLAIEVEALALVIGGDAEDRHRRGPLAGDGLRDERAQRALQVALHRARAVGGDEGHARDALGHARRGLHEDAALHEAAAPAELVELLGGDAHRDVGGERAEGHDAIDAVEELGREVLAHGAGDVVEHGRARVGAEAHRGPGARAEVGGHHHDGVLKMRRSCPRRR